MQCGVIMRTQPTSLRVLPGWTMVVIAPPVYTTSGGMRGIPTPVPFTPAVPGDHIVLVAGSCAMANGTSNGVASLRAVVPHGPSLFPQQPVPPLHPAVHEPPLCGGSREKSSSTSAC